MRGIVRKEEVFLFHMLSIGSLALHSLNCGEGGGIVFITAKPFNHSLYYHRARESLIFVSL